MKKFTKLFLSCAAAAALTAAVATSAMAADGTLKATYALDEGGATGTVTITCDSQDTMKTLLVLNKGKDLTNFTADDVLQIDQNGTITSVKLPALSENNDSHKGTYMVYMGGTSGDIYAGSFTIGGSPVKVGDANMDGSIGPQDASYILSTAVGLENAADNYTGKEYSCADMASGTYKIGDANMDGSVGPQDASYVLSTSVGLENAADNYTGKETMVSPLN